MKNILLPLSGILIGGLLGVIQIAIRSGEILVSSDTWLYGQLGDFAFFLWIYSLAGMIQKVRLLKFCLILLTFILAASILSEVKSDDPKWMDDVWAYVLGSFIGTFCAYPKK